MVNIENDIYNVDWVQFNIRQNMIANVELFGATFQPTSSLSIWQTKAPFWIHSPNLATSLQLTINTKEPKETKHDFYFF